jgi:hypothetical protein
MRWVAFLCFFSFSTAALALDDCNAKFPNLSQLEDRLKCLQSNNNGLQSQLDALKAEMGASTAKQAGNHQTGGQACRQTGGQV